MYGFVPLRNLKDGTKRVNRVFNTENAAVGTGGDGGVRDEWSRQRGPGGSQCTDEVSDRDGGHGPYLVTGLRAAHRLTGLTVDTVL